MARRAPRVTPYQRIVRAAATGRGVRLSPEECRMLARDDAISTAADNDDAQEPCPGEGRCHGCRRWCNDCGDVREVCEDVGCDQHRRV